MHAKKSLIEGPVHGSGDICPDSNSQSAVKQLLDQAWTPSFDSHCDLSIEQALCNGYFLLNFPCDPWTGPLNSILKNVATSFLR